MQVFEITGFKTGVNESGVTYLQPEDSFQEIRNGFIYRQELQSRMGMGFFTPQLDDASRVLGIFEHALPDGTKKLLAFDSNFLYVYSVGTNTFVQVPFGGSLAAYAGFNITNNSDYISGVSYSTKSNAERFVFCGEGISTSAFGSAIFFYNGTSVLDYTNIADNPDYVSSSSGKLVRARGVLYFNERLNFIAPTIVTQLNQTIIWSGIKNSAGSGDKFNAVGSGAITFSTSEILRSAAILGQSLSMLFSRSTRFLDITTDAFNPYRIRDVPSVLGTDATFSKVKWNDTIDSIGKDGILQIDNSKSLRIDNKIPFFTKDSIDQPNFNSIYGGFDRENAQFWWSYQEDGEKDTQDKVLVRSYEEESWSVYDLRISVLGYTEIGLDLAWDDIDETGGNPAWERWDTTEDIWNEIGLGDEVKKTLAGNNKGVITEINKGYDDYSTSIQAISQASDAVVSVAYHSFEAKDLVVINSSEGMTEINNFDPETNTPETIIPFEVLSVTDTSITLKIDSSNYTAHTPNTGVISKPIAFYAKTIPFNPYRSMGNKFYVSHIEVMIDSINGFLEVDVYEDEQISPFIKGVLLKPSKIDQKREWLTMTINHEANFLTFVLRQLSPSTGVKIPSIRIHGEEGGFTNG